MSRSAPARRLTLGRSPGSTRIMSCMGSLPSRSSRQAKTICGSDISILSAAAFPISWPSVRARLWVTPCVALPLTAGLSLYRGKLGLAWTGRGIGRRLMSALLTECEAKGLRQIVAVIGDSANMASIALHRRLGFTIVGTIRSAGFKFGRWVDTVLMQRSLGTGDSTLP